MPRRQRLCGYFFVAAGLVFVARLTLVPGPDAAAGTARVPLTCIACGELGGVDFFLNILLFLPLGLGLGLTGLTWRRALLLAGLLSFAIELLQLEVITGRDSSLGDLVANSTGGGIGALFGNYWPQVVFPAPRSARRLAIAWAVTLACIWAGTAWALGPEWEPGGRWYGEWAPELGNHEPSLGRLFALEAGGKALLPGRTNEEAGLKSTVTARPSMTFRAVLGPQPAREPYIGGAIIDSSAWSVLYLGQDHEDLEFRLRMRASRLKLWTPTINLPNGMHGNQGDSVEAEGQLLDGAFVVSSRIGGKRRTLHLPLSASWGWSLVTPWVSDFGINVRRPTALWIIGLLALLTYWSAMAGGSSQAIAPITTVVLLGVIPYAAHFPPAHWSEWAAAVVGIGMGGALAVTGRGVVTRSDTQG